MKSLNRKIILLIAVFSFGSTFVLRNAINELFLAKLLNDVDSIGLLVYVVNEFSVLKDIYLVRLVMSFTDLNLNLLNVFDVMSFGTIIGPISYLLVYELNKYYFKNKIIKVGVISFFSTIVLKYIAILLATVMLSKSISFIMALLLVVSIILILSNIAIIVSVILIFVGLIKIVRGVVNVREL